MNKIEQVLDAFCRDYNAKAFIPILEADVMAYMYHLWVSQFGEANKLHVDTRVYQKLDSRFDFVVGRINYGAGKPCITNPELVAELKAFPYGFTDQQHRVHYFHVIDDDLPKLQSLKDPADLRYEVLFDEDDYLKGFDANAQVIRIDHIVEIRDKRDSRIKLVYLRKIAKGLCYKFI